MCSEKLNKIRQIIILFLAVSTVATLALSQNTKIASGEKIELLNADSLIGTGQESQNITRSYEGNVAFRQGDISVKCNKAFHDISANTVDLNGNVRITQRDMLLASPKIFYNGNTYIAQSFKQITIKDKNMQLTADKGYYNTNTTIANFYGNIAITDDTVKITADSVEYNRRTQFSKAFGNAKVEDDSSVIYGEYLEYQRLTRNSKATGNVLIQSKQNNTYLVADSVENNDEQDYTIANGKPILYKIDTLKSDKPETQFDTLSIASNRMESIRLDNDERYIFSGNVEFYKNELQAKADTIIYYRERELIYMFGKPAVWNDSTQLLADTISIYLKENKLDKVIAQGAAFATICDDTTNAEKINQLLGSRISIHFVNDTIDVINAFGDAKSLFFMQSEDGKDNGATQTFADSIKISFVAGEADSFIALGGIVGEAIPDAILLKDIKKYYLPDFRRRYDRAIKRTLIDKEDKKE